MVSSLDVAIFNCALVVKEAKLEVGAKRVAATAGLNIGRRANGVDLARNVRDMEKLCAQMRGQSMLKRCRDE